jgi:hypothetical protein
MAAYCICIPTLRPFSRRYLLWRLTCIDDGRAGHISTELESIDSTDFLVFEFKLIRYS